MPTNITQDFDIENDRFVLRVSGEMTRDDAVLIEKLARELLFAHSKPVSIDLADLDLLDSEAAPILRALENNSSYKLLGLEIFVQNAVNKVER